MIKTLMVTAALLTLPLAANAADWQIDNSKSSLNFAGKQMGSTTKGKFNDFTGDITFDPANLDAAMATITIDIASMETPSPVIRGYLLNPDWFDVETYPQGTFTANTFTQQGEDSYLATGSMTLNGQTEENIEVNFTLTDTDNGKQITGETTLHRRDYGIGKGQWDDTSVVADEVAVNFDVYLTPAN